MDKIWYKDFTPFEASAGIATDKSGNGFDATLAGACEFSNFAARGKVLRFPVTTTSYAHSDSNQRMNIANGLTVGAWIWRDDNSQAMVIDRNLSFRLWFPDSSGKPRFDIHVGGNWYGIWSEIAIPTQQWVFIQAAYGPTITHIYVHGTLRGAGSPAGGAFTDSQEPVWIGRYQYGGYQFSGHIGEIIVKDAFVDLDTHRADLKRWIKRTEGSVVELLELHAPGETLRFCSLATPITLTVYDM
ncbi:MAG: LamG domain-containing protein [Nitrospirae bacterium]|nr:LamG domain-containing protein [Magnetococcales bacterium]HAT50741.1 hypothetical protein [Alphaproteobacteria bacterium]